MGAPGFCWEKAGPADLSHRRMPRRERNREPQSPREVGVLLPPHQRSEGCLQVSLRDPTCSNEVGSLAKMQSLGSSLGEGENPVLGLCVNGWPWPGRTAQQGGHDLASHRG